MAENLLKEEAGLLSLIPFPFDSGKLKEGFGAPGSIREALKEVPEEGGGLGKVVTGRGGGDFKEGLGTEKAGVRAVEDADPACIGRIMTPAGGEEMGGKEEAGGGGPGPALAEGKLGAALGKRENGDGAEAGAFPVERPGVTEEGEEGRCGETGGRLIEVLKEGLEEGRRKGCLAGFLLIETAVLEGGRGKGPGEPGAGADPGKGMTLEGDRVAGFPEEEGKLFAGIEVGSAAAGGNSSEGSESFFGAPVEAVVGALEIGYGGLKAAVGEAVPVTGKIFLEGVVVYLPEVDFEETRPGGFAQAAARGGHSGDSPVEGGGLAKLAECLVATGNLKGDEGLPGPGGG